MHASICSISAMQTPYHSYTSRGIFAAFDNALMSLTFDALIFFSGKCC